MILLEYSRSADASCRPRTRLEGPPPAHSRSGNRVNPSGAIPEVTPSRKAFSRPREADAVPDPQPGSRIGLVLGWLGLALQLLVGFPYLVSGLIVPVPYLSGIWLVWVMFALFALWLFRRRPKFVPLMPLTALAAWYGLLGLGSHFLRWTG